MVNAYWARAGTMEGAELIASIRTDICESSAAVLEGFKMLMQVVSVELVRTRLGATVEAISIESAPEHERTGNG